MDAFVQLALVWTGVLIAVVLAKKTSLTPVLYYLMIGAVFINVGLLPETPHEFVRGFAEIGIVLIMFAIGFEENVDQFLISAKRSWGIAFFGAVAPFSVTYALTWLFWHEFTISLIASLAMTATAVSLTLVVLRAEGLGSSLATTRIMTSAVLDDVATLALVAILVPIAVSGEIPGVLELVMLVSKTIAFFLIISIAGFWIFPHAKPAWLSRFRMLRNLNFRHLLSFESGEYATLILLLLALSVGILAHTFGFHPAIGAYMAGLILREEYFDYKESSNKYQEVKKIIDNVAFVWIGPVFFVLLGSQLVFTWDVFVSLIPETAALTLCLIVAQVTSAGIAARYTGGMLFAGSVMVGLGMLGRAELAFVVMDIAYVQNKILSDDAFYTLMFTAFWLNIAVPLSIRWWKPYYVKEQRDSGQ